MAHNEVRNIAKCLGAILAEDDPSLIASVVVIASGCTDGTDAVARDLAQSDPRVRVIVETTRSGKSSAINRFLQATCEPICVVVGADVVFAPHALAALVAPLRDPKVAMTGARPIPTNRRVGLVGQAVHALWDLHHQVSLRAPKMGEAVAFKRLFDAIDAGTLVDEAYIERTVTDRGGELRYVPAAVVLNHAPENLLELFYQRRRIHFGHLTLRSRTGYQPSTMRLGLITTAILSQLWLARIGLSGLMGLAALLLVESLAWADARIAFVLGDAQHAGIWRPLPSTKLLVAESEVLRAPHEGYVVLAVVRVKPAPGWRNWPAWCAGGVRVLRERALIVRSLRPEDRVGIGLFRLWVRLRTDAPGAAAAGARLVGSVSGLWSVASPAGPPAPPRWRRVLQDRFVRDSAWLTLAISTVNLSSYLINVALSRLLPRAQFGEQAALLSLFVLLAVPLSALQTLVTREEARARDEGLAPGAYFRHVRRRVMPFIAGGVVVGTAASPLVGSFLHLESGLPIVLLAVLIVSTLWLAAYRGLLQGRRRFDWLAANIGVEAGLRLLLTLGLVVVGLSVTGVVGGFAASALVLLVISWRMARPLLGSDQGPAKLEAGTGAGAAQLLPVLAALACTTALFNLDVMLSRHFLRPAEAGDYAALSLMGRLLFYLTSSIGGAVIVSVAATKDVAERDRLLAKALGLAASVALGGGLVYLLFGRLLVGAIFGSSYQEAAPALPAISLGVVGLSVTNVLVYFLLALRRVWFIGVLALAVLAEVALVAWRHGGPADIAGDFLVANMFAALGLLLLTALERASVRARRKLTVA